MSDRNLARLGAVMSLPLIVATWDMGDHFASLWFAWCGGFFFREQLSPTDGANPAPPKGNTP